MDRIEYKWGRDVGRGNQVRIRMKVMPFWLLTTGWLVRWVRRRGVVVWVAWIACMDGLEAAMNIIKYEQGMGIRWGDWVRMWTKMQSDG